MKEFEGFVGAENGAYLMGDDVLLMLVFAMIACLSVVFRGNIQLFFRMKENFFTKEGKTLSHAIGVKRWLTYFFLHLQEIVLSSLLLFATLLHLGFFLPKTGADPKIFVLITFLLLVFFSFLKKRIIALLFWTFFTPEMYKAWKTLTRSIMNLWGILLYIPALSLLLTRDGTPFAITFFLLTFIFTRFYIFYKSIFIFHSKPMGLLSISSYLCALEILPIYFVCKGSMFLFKFIETIII